MMRRSEGNRSLCPSKGTWTRGARGDPIALSGSVATVDVDGAALLRATLLLEWPTSHIMQPQV